MLASCIRILRYGALLTGLLLPAIYIAFVSFHQDWIPQQLLNIILLNKEMVPFSTAAEVLGLLIAHELLQELEFTCRRPLDRRSPPSAVLWWERRRWKRG